jgi:hypothetical protein
MNDIDYKIQAILDDKYEIELQEYWQLEEEQKDKLIQLIVDMVIKNNNNDLNYLEYHCSVLDDRRMEAEFHEEFERADMINRIRVKLLDIIQ